MAHFNDALTQIAQFNVSVENTGSVDGDEVVQVYFTQPGDAAGELTVVFPC